GPQLAGAGGRALGVVLSVATLECGALAPRLEGFLGAPARVDEEGRALVGRRQELEGFEALGLGDLAGARGETAQQLVAALRRDLQRVDLHDAHRLPPGSTSTIERSLTDLGKPRSSMRVPAARRWLSASFAFQRTWRRRQRLRATERDGARGKAAPAGHRTP